MVENVPMQGCGSMPSYALLPHYGTMVAGTCLLVHLGSDNKHLSYSCSQIATA